jgi:hypothetical protein
MRIFSHVVLLAILLTAGSAFSGELDNYYLEQFGEATSPPVKNALKASAAPVSRKCGMPLHKGLKTDWNKLESSTQKTLAKYLAKPDTTGMTAYPSSGGHFIIYYATSGTDTPFPVFPYTLSSWVQTVADTFEAVYAKEVTTMGYAPPANLPYPVYLKQMAYQGNFGITDSDVLTGQSATSWITLDNDFSDPFYGSYQGLAGLQITAAHEFHHAIQYRYNYYFDTWYAEATSTWMEDEVFDAVNQLYDYSRNYLQSPSTSLDQAVDGGYSRWVFNRLLAEDHTPVVIRSIWEKLQSTQTQNGLDIPMLPVIDSTMKDLQSSLATEFTSFAKRLYLKNWLSHTNEVNLLYPAATIENPNPDPLGLAGTLTTYPVNQENTPAATASLLHFSINYFKFVPSRSVADLTITVNNTTGIKTALFRKTSAGIAEIPANNGNSATSSSYTVNGFGNLEPGSDEVVLMAVNTTFVDKHEISFSTDGTSGKVTEPPVTPPPVSPGTSSSSKGCFIATAAYGSYLHPKVMLLRSFRDNYLLTNPPGRALVAAYYRLSPPLAAIIARHDTLRFTARLFLAPVIFAVEHLWWALAASGGSGTILLAVMLRRRKRMCPSPCL